jgi:hypothetical protein
MFLSMAALMAASMPVAGVTIRWCAVPGFGKYVAFSMAELCCEYFSLHG